MAGRTGHDRKESAVRHWRAGVRECHRRRLGARHECGAQHRAEYVESPAVPCQVAEPLAIERPDRVVRVALEGHAREVARLIRVCPDVATGRRDVVEGDPAPVRRDPRTVIPHALGEQHALVAGAAHTHQLALESRDVHHRPIVGDGELGESGAAERDASGDLDGLAGQATARDVEGHRLHRVVQEHGHEIPHRVAEFSDRRVKERKRFTGAQIESLRDPGVRHGAEGHAECVAPTGEELLEVGVLEHERVAPVRSDARGAIAEYASPPDGPVIAEREEWTRRHTRQGRPGTACNGHPLHAPAARGSVEVAAVCRETEVGRIRRVRDRHGNVRVESPGEYA